MRHVPCPRVVPTAGRACARGPGVLRGYVPASSDVFAIINDTPHQPHSEPTTQSHRYGMRYQRKYIVSRRAGGHDTTLLGLDSTRAPGGAAALAGVGTGGPGAGPAAAPGPRA